MEFVVEWSAKVGPKEKERKTLLSLVCGATIATSMLMHGLQVDGSLRVEGKYRSMVLVCMSGFFSVCEYHNNGASKRGMARDSIEMSLKLKRFHICRNVSWSCDWVKG